MKARVLSGASVLGAAHKKAKFASVLPAGTEVTRQGATNDFKKGRIMVVKPVARAYILSGRMMSSLAVGDWLLKKRWPMLVFMIVGMVLHILLFFGVFSEMGMVTGGAGVLVVVASPTALSWSMYGLTAGCWGLSILAMLTRVHSQLLWMTLRTFDPWVPRGGWGSVSVSVAPALLPSALSPKLELGGQLSRCHLVSSARVPCTMDSEFETCCGTAPF